MTEEAELVGRSETARVELLEDVEELTLHLASAFGGDYRWRRARLAHKLVQRSFSGAVTSGESGMDMIQSIYVDGRTRNGSQALKVDLSFYRK